MTTYCSLMEVSQILKISFVHGSKNRFFLKCLPCFFQSFDTGPVWIEALPEDVSEEILFALERAIGQEVGDSALAGDLGRGGGF